MMLMSETSHTVVTAIAEYIAQLEAEIEDLKGANLPLYSDRIRNLETRIAELEAERDRLRSVCAEAYQMAGAAGAPERVLDILSDASRGLPLRHDTMLPVAPDEFEENALLRKALTDAPIPMAYLGNIAFFNAYDKWWKSRRALLARIPEAKQ